jgi:hypothetical protein
MRHMSNLNRSSRELYSEMEAAAALGISIARLHELLDRYIFTVANTRPQSIEFTASDLLLLGYWNNLAPPEPDPGPPQPGKIIPMPKRR